MITTQIERQDAIRMLYGSRQAMRTTLDRRFVPFSVSIALTPQEVAALMDFAEEN